MAEGHYICCTNLPVLLVITVALYAVIKVSQSDAVQGSDTTMLICKLLLVKINN